MPSTARQPEITVAAVLKYARTLRERAQRARAGDPYATPYEISDQAARKVSQEFGPAKALEVIAGRAVLHERKQRESEARVARAASELYAHQMVSKGEREAHRSRWTVGQRLDHSLHALAMLSETSAAQLDGDRITGSRERSIPMLRKRERFEDTRESLMADAGHLVHRIEKYAESQKRRLVEEAA